MTNFKERKWTLMSWVIKLIPPAFMSLAVASPLNKNIETCSSITGDKDQITFRTNPSADICSCSNM